MQKLLVIIGRGGVGKDTLCNELEQYGIHKLVSYTTRPKRSNEIDGKEYYFISDELFNEMTIDKLFTEIETFNTKLGVFKYGSILDEKLPNKTYSCIKTEKGLFALQSYVKEHNLDIEVIPIRLYVDNKTWLRRIESRIQIYINDNEMLEIARRMISDITDYPSGEFSNYDCKALAQLLINRYNL